MAESVFAQRKSNSVYWRNKSNDLLGAAGLIWAGILNNEVLERKTLGLPDWYSFEIACPPVFRMLCGMSVELLIKAIIVQRGDEPKQTHNLNRLAEQATLCVAREHAQLLSVLTESVVWHGRYPVPKTRPAFDRARELERDALTRRVPLGSFSVLHPNHALNWENFLGIWNKFDEIYRASDA